MKILGLKEVETEENTLIKKNKRRLERIAFTILPLINFIYNNDAKQKNEWEMTFDNCHELNEKSGLNNKFDDFQVVAVFACEPNPGVVMAFCIDCVGLRNMDILSSDKIMCSVTKVNEKFKFDFEPFISYSLKMRVKCMLRGQKMSFSDIGKSFGVDASTVLRKLASLSEPYNTNLEKAWLECCYELLEIESGVEEENDDHEENDYDDYDDDDDNY